MAALRRCTLEGEDYLHLGDLVQLLRSSAPAARSGEATEVLDRIADMLAGGGRRRGTSSGGGLVLPAGVAPLLPAGMRPDVEGTELAEAFAAGQPVVSHELTRKALPGEQGAGQ